MIVLPIEEKRAGRASKIFREGRARNLYPCEYLVIGDRGLAYHVNIAELTCTCPDHYWRKALCKHIAAAVMQEHEEYPVEGWPVGQKPIVAVQYLTQSPS